MWLSRSELRSASICLVFLCSERWNGSVRDCRTLLSGRRGGRLLRRDAEGACSVGHLLYPDGGLRRGPHHPVAAAGPSLPTQRLLRGDNRRVLAGPPPHQVTERKCTGEQNEQAGRQWAETIHSDGERACTKQCHSALNVWLTLDCNHQLGP